MLTSPGSFCTTRVLRGSLLSLGPTTALAFADSPRQLFMTSRPSALELFAHSHQQKGRLLLVHALLPNSRQRHNNDPAAAASSSSPSSGKIVSQGKAKAKTKKQKPNTSAQGRAKLAPGTHPIPVEKHLEYSGRDYYKGGAHAVVEASLPRVAIAGRPNVGKSALFNRLVGAEIAVVFDRPSVTRDRLYAPVTWNSCPFLLTDTGGLMADAFAAFDPEKHAAVADIIGARGLPSLIERQAAAAIAEASVVVLCVDAMTGLNPAEQEVAAWLQRSYPDLPVIVAVNKSEGHRWADGSAAEFWRLGLGEPISISAVTGSGTGDLLDRVVEALRADKGDPSIIDGFAGKDALSVGVPPVGPEVAEQHATEEGALLLSSDHDYDANYEDVVMMDSEMRDVSQNLREGNEGSTPSPAQHAAAPIAVAIIGRPNVGKSSLLNSILGEERSIVSDVAGTTRDAVDSAFTAPDGTRFTLVDTAGVRKRSAVASARDGAEELSIQRALRAVRRADVVVLVLDATQPAGQQDARLAEFIAESGRACVLAVNKCDAVVVEGDHKPVKPGTFPPASLLAEQELQLRASLRPIEWANIVFCSAATGRRVDRVLEAVKAAAAEHRRRVSTATLNMALREAVGWRLPPTVSGGKQPRVYYGTQASVAPPTFVLFTNLDTDRRSTRKTKPDRMPDDYTRYMERQLREQIGFEGSPIRVFWRGRQSK